MMWRRFACAATMIMSRRAGRCSIARSPAGCPATDGWRRRCRGGLDSAGIAATAARLLGDRRLDAYLRVPGGPHPYDAVDERSLAGAVAARYPNIDLTIIDADHQYTEDIEPESEAALFDVPRGRGLNAGWFQPLNDAAKAAGTDVMLTGGCGNLTLSFEGVPNFAGDLGAGRWGAAWRAMATTARKRHQSVPRFLAAHVLKPVVPYELRRRRARAAAGGRYALGGLCHGVR